MILSTLLLSSLASAKALSAPLFYKDQYYETRLNVGTPGQSVRAIFDTGSPLIWVKGANSTSCQHNACTSGDLFNVSESSTWRYTGEGANWGGHGMWGHETVSYAGISAPNMNVYVTKDKLFDAPKNPGIFGQSADKDGNASFVQRLASTGEISRAMFSVITHEPIFWANDGPTGEVIYGGIDTAKYQGNMTTLSHPDSYGGMGVEIDGILVDGEQVPNEVTHTIVLDTGGVLTRLTKNTMDHLVSKYEGGFNQTENKYWVKCGSKPTVGFKFGYTTIDIDLSHEKWYEPKDGTCFFSRALAVVDSKTATLLQGAALISRAYVVYDHDRRQIHIAKAKYTDESHVIEVTGDIPGAVEWSPKK